MAREADRLFVLSMEKVLHILPRAASLHFCLENTVKRKENKGTLSREAAVFPTRLGGSLLERASMLGNYQIIKGREEYPLKNSLCPSDAIKR